MDIPGNEAANGLAKEATQLVPDSYETSFAYLGSQIKAINNLEWQAILNEYDLQPSQNPATYRKQFY